LGSDPDAADSNPSQTNLDLGFKLKLLREAFGLSQRELAKRAGVTNSNISMIEQGQVSPSVQSLAKILDAFPMSLADFFSCHLLAGQSPVIESKTIQTEHLATGISVQHLSAGFSLPNLKRMCFPVGKALPLETADSDCLGWVLSGELTLNLSAQVFLLKSRDAFHLRQGQIFGFANHHTQDAEILLAYSLENR
jgi:transcriptional regulator with XRE-family HTH domain